MTVFQMFIAAWLTSWISANLGMYNVFFALVWVLSSIVFICTGLQLIGVF